MVTGQMVRLVSKGHLAARQDDEWGKFDAQHAGLGSAGHQVETLFLSK